MTSYRAGCEFSRVPILLTLAIVEAKSGSRVWYRQKNVRTSGQRGGWKAHDPGMFCSCTPEMYEPPMHAFSPHISRGYADQQNSQPVNTERNHQRLGNQLLTPVPDLGSHSGQVKRRERLGGLLSYYYRDVA
jgi:hypothetical protein